MRNWLSRRSNVLILFWVVLTVVILINNGLFYIDEYLSHPQHGYFDDFKKASEIIKGQGAVTPYRWYFYLDALWALSLVLIIGNIIKKDLRKDRIFGIGRLEVTVFSFYVLFMSFGYLFDIIEGVLYIFFIEDGLAGIVEFKIAFYALGLLCLVYWVLKKYIIPNVRDLFRFVETSFLSLLFIIIIYGLVTLMPQGGTLVVELFYGGSNIIIFFALLTFLTIIVSHFPVYVDIWRYGNNKCVKLEMPKRKYRFFGFDIIYYIPIYTDKNEMARYNRPLIAKMRRSLGILLFVAIFNIFMGVGFRFFEVNASASGLSLLILIFTLIIYNIYGKKYDKWNVNLYSGTASQKEQTVKQIVSYVGWFPYYFLLCILLVFITFWIAVLTQWNRVSLILFLLTLGFQMFLYVYFKIARSYFKYVFFTPKFETNRPDLFNKEILNTFKTYAKENHNKKKNFLLRFVATLSDNIRYLQLMRFAGMLSLLTLIAANFSFTVASFLNPLNVIVLYIILFYSLLIITFKHILYYHRVPTAAKVKYRKTFKYGLPSILIILFCALMYLTSLPNDLHELQLVKMEKPLMDYEEFLDGMTQEWPDKKQNYFFVGSYGGGLKANLWNLLLLNELEKESDEEFLARTIAFSGVSGGAVGIGNYTSLLRNSKDSIQIAERIDSIGRSNVLSNEITYLMGADWLRESMPFLNHQGRDRSYKSMKNHAKLTGMDLSTYNEIGFSDFWDSVYRKRNKKFPALIINTTSVEGRQGVASTVKFPSNVFPGAQLINLFEENSTGETETVRYKDSTLAYFGAVSTTNRFPFFSPTAKILNKGSFLDGGYFENSGMLSAAEVYDAVDGDSNGKYRDRINPVFVNIINSEDYYILQKLSDWGFKVVRANDAGEIAAIIGTLTSIDKLTGYMHGKMESRNFVVEKIMMPHKITYKKVKNVLNADVDNPIRLMDSIKKHNSIIDMSLYNSETYDYEKWGVIEPPMARLLGEPAVEYQKAMVTCHPDIQNAIDRIILYYLVSEEEVTKDAKEDLMQMQVTQKDIIQLINEEKRQVTPDSLKLEN